MPGCITLILTAIILLASSTTAKTNEHIHYRLKWLFNTSAVGDLYAMDKGFFQNSGLDVTVKSGGPERDAIREIELGHAQFGVASADQVIRAHSKGSPIVVIAQLFQVNPLQWIYRADERPIKRIQDLKGKIIGITYGGNDETIMRTLLAKGNIKEKEITLFRVRYNYTPFYKNRVYMWPVYRNAQGIILGEKLKKEGEGIQFFNPADYGVWFVANSVVTSRQMLNKNPDTVKKFITALLAGWETSLDPANEQNALDVLRNYDRDTPHAIQEKQLAETRKLIVPPNNKKIGYIDIGAWKQTERIMLKQKLISKPVFVEKILKPVND